MKDNKPAGTIPNGILIAVTQSSLWSSPFTTYKAYKIYEIDQKSRIKIKTSAFKVDSKVLMVSTIKIVMVSISNINVLKYSKANKEGSENTERRDALWHEADIGSYGLISIKDWVQLNP